ncbi:hypothetical protein ACQP1K_02030 [Sphaerimonospora sp. CA-214678]|uniref:hypothetical protein n=1 Tax=Sphaerimonospora sp. CA-214678 TaxID=3240029 RepID=UPI003D922783
MRLDRIFIAGTIQGSNRGTDIEDQSYRIAIPAMVARFFPGAECFDPSADVADKLADPTVAALVRSLLSDTPPTLETASLPAQLTELRTIFHDMTREVAKCDLCIAYLPGHTPSMGTAMEMYAAYLSDVPIVTVTDMVANLAVVSVSTWILRDLEVLEEWLAQRSSSKGGIPA